jgi:hypothetical protein
MEDVFQQAIRGEDVVETTDEAHEEPHITPEYGRDFLVSGSSRRCLATFIVFLVLLS